MAPERKQKGWGRRFRQWFGRSLVSDASVRTADLADFKAFTAGIGRVNASQSNSGMLDSIRAYNHQIVIEFDKITSLVGVTLLDIGASPHGYAMEKCLELGVDRYVGIGLEIDSPEDVAFGNSTGCLRNMNAHHLEFADNTFDAVVSMSTFEHIADVPKALAEIHRVLRPSGKALLSFEPLWTCSYGHHLHHFGAISDLVPSWAHLVWDRHEMRTHLLDKWPDDAPLSLDEAISWIYDDDVINRVGISRMRDFFMSSPMDIEWMLPMMHEEPDTELLLSVAEATGLTSIDLRTKGLSVLLSKH